jgi:hypothetical protein
MNFSQLKRATKHKISIYEQWMSTFGYPQDAEFLTNEKIDLIHKSIFVEKEYLNNKIFLNNLRSVQAFLLKDSIEWNDRSSTQKRHKIVSKIIEDALDEINSCHSSLITLSYMEHRLKQIRNSKIKHISTTVTAQDLIEYGLSVYATKQILQKLNFTKTRGGTRIYSTSDVIDTINEKILNLKSSSKNFNKLQSVLLCLYDSRSKDRIKTDVGLLVAEACIDIEYSLERRKEIIENQIELSKLATEEILDEYEKINKRIKKYNSKYKD